MMLTGTIDVSNQNDQLIYNGALKSNNFDIVELMRTTGLVQQETEFSGSIEASETLNFEFDFIGDQSELALENFQGNLGKLIFRQRQISVSRTNILL